MKKIIQYFILTAAVGAVLASCQREQLPGTATGASDGHRVISVDFADATKTAIDGKKSTFKAGDIILVSNGKELEDCPVEIDAGGNAQITTTLQGDLDAVYPIEAAVYTGYDIDLDQIVVPEIQSGRFEDANICTSTISADGSSATFVSRCAILKFYVDKSIGVTSIDVTSSGADIATGYKTITVAAPSGKTLADVTDDPLGRICYIAVLPGISTSSLKFTTVTTTQGTAERQSLESPVTLAANTLYKILIPYYIDLGAAGKWGYCNVGAFLPEEFGTHFSWGNTVNDSGGKYSGVTLPATAQYDAAVKHWGPSWRMPTGNGGEFGVLVDKTNKGWEPLNGVNGYRFKNKSSDDIYVFFPATFESATRGMYWSRSRRSGQTNTASQLDFTASYVDAGRSHQSKFYRGRPIRAIHP